MSDQVYHYAVSVANHGDARSAMLRDAIRRYFRSRNEDSIEL